MAKQHDPAFPSQEIPFYSGMTLRDWFAGQALKGMIGSTHGVPHVTLADWAYDVADKMLKRREE